MALVFAAVLPHSPLLMPNIGKDNLSLFASTLKATKIVAEKIALIKPDIILIISHDQEIKNSAFAINISPDFISDLSAFGDFVTRVHYTGELALAYRCREQLEAMSPLHLITNENLNYTASIALSLAGVNEKNPILPLYTSNADIKTHYALGRQLQDCILSSEKKVVIIASADLSHRLNKKSPAGYLAKAKKLDQKIINCLTNDKIKELLAISKISLDEALIEDFEVIATLTGLLKGFNWPGQLLSYESPFGIGHPVIYWEA
jgi:aromatic ring-opening dioxygenase LigB subunit